jgi:DNA-binding transcriptional regulator YdaS (Cro superfamily)
LSLRNNGFFIDRRAGPTHGDELEPALPADRETIHIVVTRKEPNVYRRTLARAIEIAGGQENLARFLACTPAEIGKWSSGESNPPMPIFLAMVDITAANALTPEALENLPAARARRSTWIPAPNSR